MLCLDALFFFTKLNRLNDNRIFELFFCRCAAVEFCFRVTCLSNSMKPAVFSGRMEAFVMYICRIAFPAFADDQPAYLFDYVWTFGIFLAGSERFTGLSCLLLHAAVQFSCLVT